MILRWGTEELFKDVLNPKQLEGLRLLVTPFPQQQFNATHDRRTPAPSQGVACLDCHVNGHTNAATHLGLHDSSRLFEKLLLDAIEAIPSCEDRDVVAAWVSRLGDKLVHSFRASQAKTADAPASGDGAADSI